MDDRKLVKKAERDPWNRLNSILEDADWVASFCKSRAADLPIIPNLRCGLWYVSHASSGAYFKSTDGHTLDWTFSLKRYNLDLLNTIQEHDGCVLVDSTRRGKSMPDAFSKTIPIWCAVLNAASQRRHGQPASTTIHLPDTVVSPSEQEQIVGKIDQWVETLLSSELFIPILRKPLRPVFVTRSAQEEGVKHLKNRMGLEYYPIVLISASQMVPTPGLDPLHSPITKSSLNLTKETEALRRQSRYVYVQGSGDDEEMWSFHLTPSLFWEPANLHRILGIGEGGQELENTLKVIVEESKMKSIGDVGTIDFQLGNFGIFLGTRASNYIFTQSEKDLYSLIIQADAKSIQQDKVEAKTSCTIFRLDFSSGKRGLSAFRLSIPKVIGAVRLALPGKVLLCSQEPGLGNDLVGGLAVAILAACFNNNRHMVTTTPSLTKEDIKRRLQWIISLLPNFSAPSRGHLLRVNEVLLSGPYRDDNTADEESQLVHRLATMSAK